MFLPVSMEGQLFRDESGEKIILVDGIISSLFYAYDRFAHKSVINDTLARTFGFENLKNSRKLFYEAFQLLDGNGKMPDKRTETTLLQDLWEKVGKVDMSGYNNVIVCCPYNFTYPQFVSDAEFLSNTSKDTVNTMLVERIEKLEKQMEGRDTTMMNMLTNINQHVMKGSGSLASSCGSYAAVASQSRLQGSSAPPSHMRERSASFKRSAPAVPEIQPAKKRNIEKTVVVGSSSVKTRKMRSPPADIFVYGLNKSTTKEEIVADLAEGDILITVDDIELKSRDNTHVSSYRISVQAEDLKKAMDPTLWPLRVKVREYIYYKKKYISPVNQSGNNSVRQNVPTTPALIVQNRFNSLQNNVSA